jgi:hypothetical protein
LHALPGDLPPDTVIQKHPAVIDVRFVKADASAATVFDSWLRFHATRQHPIFVLANAATSTAILSALREASEPAVMTIGIAGHHFSPSISVESSAAEEKRAYQALDDGATVASLITDHPDKQRNDEASLTKPPPVDGDLAPTPDEPTEAKTPATEPPVDAALQRAVQLFRGLKALKAL